MRPYDTDHVELLRIARARAEELRLDWQAVNRGRLGRDRRAHGPRSAFVRVAREATGRRLIDLGRRLLPAEVEPCS
jgi:hypothetical protein